MVQDNGRGSSVLQDQRDFFPLSFPCIMAVLFWVSHLAVDAELEGGGAVHVLQPRPGPAHAIAAHSHIRKRSESVKSQGRQLLPSMCSTRPLKSQILNNLLYVHYLEGYGQAAHPCVSALVIMRLPCRSNSRSSLYRLHTIRREDKVGGLAHLPGRVTCTHSKISPPAHKDVVSHLRVGLSFAPWSLRSFSLGRSMLSSCVSRSFRTSVDPYISDHTMAAPSDNCILGILTSSFHRPQTTSSSLLGCDFFLTLNVPSLTYGTQRKIPLQNSVITPLT